MKYWYLVLLFVTQSIVSQNYTITYEKWSNGVKIENQDPILVYTNSSLTLVSSEGIFSGKNDFPLEQIYINRNNLTLIQSAQLNKNKFIATKDSLALSKQTFELVNETKTILGYKCQKAKTIINSNTIELWYTNDLNVKGAPTVLGQNLGLVLEMNRNNNFVITATKIEKQKKFPSNIALPKTQFSDGLTYRDLLWKSRFITLPVFENETINFSDQSKSNDSILRFANGTVILRKVKFPEIKNGSPIFVELKTNSTGDAYDRTGSLFVIPVKGENTFFNGLKNGMEEKYDIQNGILKSKIEFLNNNINGIYLTFYANGKLKDSSNYVLNIEHGKWKQFNENGTLKGSGEFNEGIETGEWKWYNDGKLFMVGHFKNGLRDGEWLYYFPNSGIIEHLAYFKSGEKDGEWKYNYPDGKTLKLINFKNDKKNGKTLVYYEDGKLEREGNFKDDKEDGKWTSYYRNTKVNEVGDFKMGVFNVFVVVFIVVRSRR